MNHLPPTATHEDKIVLVTAFDRKLFPDVFFLPIRLLLGWMCTSLVIYFLNAVWSTREPVRFQHIISLEIHAEAVMVLGQFAASGIVLFSSNHNLSEGFAIPLGLDIIVPSTRDTWAFMSL